MAWKYRKKCRNNNVHLQYSVFKKMWCLVYYWHNKITLLLGEYDVPFLVKNPTRKFYSTLLLLLIKWINNNLYEYYFLIK